MKQFLKVATYGLAATLSLGAASTAHAQLIVSDSFVTVTSNPVRANGQYLNGSALNASATNSQVNPLAAPTTFTNVSGFTTASNAGGFASAQFSTTTNGLQYAAIGAAAGTSGKLNYGAAGLDGQNRSVGRNLAATPPTSSTYLMSFLLNRGSYVDPLVGTARDFVGVGFGGSAVPTIGTTGLTGLYIGFAGDNGGLALRYRSNTTGNVIQSTIQSRTDGITGGSLDDTTYLVVAQIDVNVSGTADRLTYYVNPTDFTSTSTMASTSLLTGNFTDGNLLSAPNDFVRFNIYARNFNINAYFDEVRFGALTSGLTPASALGISAVVSAPEPGSITLALPVAALGLTVVRRRKVTRA